MSKIGLIRFVLPVSAGLMLLGSGCVSKKIEPEYIPRVSTSQNYDGLVTISWPSRAGYDYRLVARDQGKVHIDRNVYKGTGETIVVEFTRDPGKPLPDYSVKPEKTKKK